MKHIRGYKIRIYPTREQEKDIWQSIGASRWIWNHMLDVQEENYANGGKFISAYSMNKLLTPLKKQTELVWLNEVSNTMLQRTCADLAEAYTRFFKGTANHPKKKNRKKSRPAFPVRCDSVKFKDGKVHVEKLGWMKYKSDFQFPEGRGHKFSNVRLSYLNDKYYLSFGMECESQAPQLTDDNMGIDLGIKELAVVACGDKQLFFHNINKSKKVRNLKRKLKRVSRSISRKYEASRKRNGGRYEKTKNIKKLEEEQRRLYARLTGIRHNYLHQITHQLVSMLPKRVVMEDLNISGMMKNRHKSKAIQEQCWYEFIRQMRYKCEWNGIEFAQAGRFYPSSKTCSCCGGKKADLTEKDRTFVCPHCGFTLDRDLNAAINLMRYADHVARTAA